MPEGSNGRKAGKVEIYMAEFNGTPHNTAKVGDIAKTVLMPGDPLRAKFIAENLLDDPVEFNHVRGMLGYTGTYKGVPVSVMGSGMGMPSIGIYSYELYNFYGVENIIRIGSAGAMVTDLKLFDVVLVDAAYSQSTFAREAWGFTEDLMYPSPELNKVIEDTAAELGKTVKKGIILSSDNFYSDYSIEREPAPYKTLCAEMESFGLFANARQLGKKAACLLTISDSIVTHEETTAEERQTAFIEMMEIALNTAIKL
jgi:purine-nucleoside phosphorylase